MWTYLWERNTFYRQRFIAAGLTQESLKTPADLARIPLLTKKEIRGNTGTILSAGFRKEHLLHFKTGGSTGKALDIFITDECSELRNACARRHDRWTGWEPGEPIGAAWGNPKLPKTLREKFLNGLIQPHIYLDTMAVSEKSVRQFVDEWEKKQPTLLFGHAHSLFVLALQVESLNLRGIKPRGILSTSMMLLPHERERIEKTFGCKVTDRYGCEEVSLIGCECEKHDGMHMNIEHLVIEFISDDGSAAAPGEPGRIVVTDLMNKAMPFIRYQVEDIGIPLDKECGCGRGLPLMGKVAGRVADFLMKKDGTQVAGISLIENTLTRLPGIDQMQIVQENIDLINVNIVQGESWCPEVGNELKEYFKQVFVGTENIEVVTVKEIIPEKSGKYRFSICKI